MQRALWDAWHRSRHNLPKSLAALGWQASSDKFQGPSSLVFAVIECRNMKYLSTKGFSAGRPFLDSD